MDLSLGQGPNSRVNQFPPASQVMSQPSPLLYITHHQILLVFLSDDPRVIFSFTFSSPRFRLPSNVRLLGTLCQEGCKLIGLHQG